MTPSLRFNAAMRLKTTAEFRRAFDRKRSAASPQLILYAVEPPDGRPGPRLGLSVSKKLGNAVVRNRLKRQLREAFRLGQWDLAPLDYVAVPRAPTTDFWGDLTAEFVALARQVADRLKKP